MAAVRIAVLLLLALLQACATGGAGELRPAESTAGAGAADGTLFIVRRGWHIDIGLDAAEVPTALSSLQARFPGARYFLFGFGDRRYLEARQRGTVNLLGAVWPGEGLILVTALRGTPAEAFATGAVVNVEVDRGMLDAARARIAASVQTDPPSAGNGPYEGSLYLPSTLRYSGLHTCNTWAAEVLEAAGLPVHSRGVLFASQLWAQVRSAPYRLTAPQ